MPVGTVRLIAVMPAYNEAATVVAVLDGLRSRVDGIVAIDDGSTDGTGNLLETWAASAPGQVVIRAERNAGKSAALRLAWAALRARRDAGDLDDDDLVVAIDADGQHDPRLIEILVERTLQHGFDAVLGARVLNYHRWPKRLGNQLMSWIGSVCGGTPFADIETGYRVFRLGPLLHAQEFYAGTRYSEGCELAVVLARLGYRVDNSLPIAIPVARTRTHLRDALRHTLAMPAAWYRVAAWRGTAARERSRAGLFASAAVFAVFLAMLGVMLTHRMYLGADSAQSYGRVGYVSEALVRRHALPLHVATLEDGRAVTFPYAVIPWLPDALLYPLLGDWTVTASMAVGAIALVLGVWYWLPRTRQPVVTALILLNPELWGGVAQFQIATIWAFALAALAGGAAARGRRTPLVLVAAAAVAAHPLMGTLGLLATCILPVARRPREAVRRSGWLAVAIVVASPAIWMFLETPLLHEADDRLAVLLSALRNVSRVSVLVIPLLCARYRGPVLARQTWLLAAGAAAVVAVLCIVPPSGLWDRTPAPFGEFLAAHPPTPAERYRVLVTTNHEQGMVQLMRADAVLAQEFFDESIQRRSFQSATAYSCFLEEKGATRILASGEYARTAKTDELTLLARLVEQGDAVLDFRGPDGTVDYALVPGGLSTSASKCAGPDKGFILRSPWLKFRPLRIGVAPNRRRA